MNPEWHVAGTAVLRTPDDQHEHRSHIDMQIMMAVLTAMQDERDRLAAETAEAAAVSPAETPRA